MSVRVGHGLADRRIVGPEHWLVDKFGHGAHLGARPAPPALQAKREQQRQANLDLKRVLEQRDEELAAARETNLRLMNQLNRPAS
jgi:hypothetical protein